MTLREFIHDCRVRASLDQYIDPDAHRKALLAVETFADGDEAKAHTIMQTSGKNVDMTVWIRV